MIPAAQTLQKAARQTANDSHSAVYLDDIQSFIADTLPNIERALEAATAGPAPLDAAARQLVLAGGKRVRPVATLLSCAAVGGDPRAALAVATAAELVHSATLLHDDVMDDGVERRGRPAARVVHGNLVSVLAGDLLLTRALAIVHEAQPSSLRDLVVTLERLVEGEVAQLHARGRLDLGSAGYLHIVEGKTASLFGFACRAGARAGAGSDDDVRALGRFGEQIGVAFQIVDDVLDLSGRPEEVGKKLGADLGEGKTTLPLALALEDDVRLAELLPAARRGDDAAARDVAGRPSVRRGCERARELARDRTAAALGELHALPPSSARDVLRHVAEDLVARAA